jgi:hypothetical protein
MGRQLPRAVRHNVGGTQADPEHWADARYVVRRRGVESAWLRWDVRAAVRAADVRRTATGPTDAAKPADDRLAFLGLRIPRPLTTPYMSAREHAVLGVGCGACDTRTIAPTTPEKPRERTRRPLPYLRLRPPRNARPVPRMRHDSKSCSPDPRITKNAHDGGSSTVDPGASGFRFAQRVRVCVIVGMDQRHMGAVTDIVGFPVNLYFAYLAFRSVRERARRWPKPQARGFPVVLAAGRKAG